MDDSFLSYLGDVAYDVWCGGGSPDAIDHDRVRDDYQAGEFAEDASESELRRQVRTTATE